MIRTIAVLFMIVLLFIQHGTVVASREVIEMQSNVIEQQDRELDQLDASISKLEQRLKQLEELIPKKTASRITLSAAEQECLMRNVFHEAGTEPRAGKIAVAQLTVQRLKSKKWGRNLCAVVYAKNQFPWTKQRSKRWSKPKGPRWVDSVAAVKELQQGYRIPALTESLFYHRVDSNTVWDDKMTMVAVIGNHAFYNNTDSG